MTKRFSINETSASYEVATGMTATLDMTKAFPNLAAQATTIKEAVVFALKTALRNATAGKMETAELVAEAFDAVKKRCAALESGVWASRREGSGGESRQSVLARALAAVMNVEVAAAVAFIDEQVSADLEANGIDPEAADDDLSEAEKTKKSEITRKIRKEISSDAGVKVKMATLKAEDALAKAETTEKENAGKVSKFAK